MTKRGRDAKRWQGLRLRQAVLWRSALAKVLATQGDGRKAARYATEAVTLAAETDWLCIHGDALMDLAAVHHMTDDPGRAATSIQSARLLYQRKGDLASIARTTAFQRMLRSPP